MEFKLSNEKKVVGWSYRYINEKKYVHSSSFPRGKFLYGEHLLGSAKDCVVVEGFFDVLKVYQTGYQVVGILGTNCTKVQFVRLINMLPPSVDSRIILFLDGDTAGSMASKKIYDEYSSLYKIVVVDRLIGQDPSDLTEEQLNEILSKYSVGRRDETEGRQI
ncbi:MAG: toprim domain-containing protein [Candidatus Kryptonium sp.]